MSTFREQHRRATHLIVAVGLGVSGIGFIYGVHRTPAPSVTLKSSVAPVAVPSQVSPAPTYTKLGLGTARWGQAAAPLESSLPGPPRVTKPVERTMEALAEARKRRASRRAFAGAPPVIPHPTATRGYPECLACHETGVTVGSRTAPPMSHPVYASCQQCHAPADELRADHKPPRELALANGFVGRRGSPTGGRAWPGAPPTIPHSTFMRERCGSCHGALSTGPATSHPWRQSCEQCHASDAGLDRRPGPLAQGWLDAPPLETGRQPQ